jgi:hypothetical protein
MRDVMDPYQDALEVSIMSLTLMLRAARGLAISG